ncbi:MAG: hypothetical protein OXF28_04085 [Thaumarchaeota archaeon]|nr:hypothetical protein [Nitrososphaerota archaeon]MCY3976291.1 hypothetical protein [Nitrososphaerota archaeon]
MDKQELCKHQIVYFGVININVNKKTIGSIDVWRCSSCKTKFCEEKQLGVESISEKVGMPHIQYDEKWAILICKVSNIHKWKLIKLKNNIMIKHECVNDEMITLSIINYGVNDQNHYFVIVDDNINKAIEI